MRSVETIIDEHVVREIIPALKAGGAEGIIEYPLNKVVYSPGVKSDATTDHSTCIQFFRANAGSKVLGPGIWIGYEMKRSYLPKPSGRPR